MLEFETPDGRIAVAIQRLVIAGWTGRDSAAVQHHIAELAALGVAPPSTTPLFYQVSAALATQAARIQVLGAATSGEVEPLVINVDGTLWLGLGSDHTDRQLEAVSVAQSKQACAKVLSHKLWPLAAVADRLDALALRAEIDGGTLYQDGSLAAILPLSGLIAAADLQPGDAMLCGTLPAIGGVRPATSYRMSLTDQTLGTIALQYDCDVLEPVA